MIKAGNEGDLLPFSSCILLIDLKKVFSFLIYTVDLRFLKNAKEYRLQYSVLSVYLTQSSRK